MATMPPVSTRTSRPRSLRWAPATILTALAATAAAAPAAGQLDPTALRAYVESVPADTFCATYSFAPVCRALETAGPDFVKQTPAGLLCAFGAAAGPVCGELAAVSERARVLEDSIDDARATARVTTARSRSAERENARLRGAARRSVAARIKAMPPDDVWPLVAVIAQRLAHAGAPYGASRYVDRGSGGDFASWTITRSVFRGG